MYVRIHTDLAVTQSGLHDRVLGIRYMLSRDAVGVLRLLRQQPFVDRLTPLIAKQYGVSRTEAYSALYKLLGSLDAYGGVRVSGISPAAKLRYWATGIFWRVRYRSSIQGYLQSMMRAYGALLAVSTLAYSALAIAVPAMPTTWVLLPGLLLVSCAVHEAGHATMAHILKVPYVFIARPGLSAILYARPAIRKGRAVAAAGPLAAALTCMPVLIFSQAKPAMLIAAATALIHLFSLLPWTADGKTVWSRQ